MFFISIFLGFNKISIFRLILIWCVLILLLTNFQHILKTIEHKFIDELKEVETEKIFAGRSISGQNHLLIVGTFNPQNEMVKKTNLSDWFYGRKKNNFWHYVPNVIIGKSLKEEEKETWVRFCKDNKIVIVDLIKSIKSNEELKSFSDFEIELKIKDNFLNADLFKADIAFDNSRFDYVIFTRKTWDNKIPKLRMARNEFIKNLIAINAINSKDQVLFCPAPWGNFKKREKEWEANLKFIKEN